MIRRPARRGDIRDRRLVLTIDGKESKTKILADGTVEHNLKWEGKVVLKRFEVR